MIQDTIYEASKYKMQHAHVIILMIRCIDLCDKYGLYVVAEANQESHGLVIIQMLFGTPLFVKQILERSVYCLYVIQTIRA